MTPQKLGYSLQIRLFFGLVASLSLSQLCLFSGQGNGLFAESSAHKADISWRCAVSASCWPSPRSSPSSSPSSSSPPTPTVTSSSSGWTWARLTSVSSGCSPHIASAPTHSLSNSSGWELASAPSGRFSYLNIIHSPHLGIGLFDSSDDAPPSRQYQL